MKRFLILALVCLMLLPVLAACGNKTTPPATTTEKKTEAGDLSSSEESVTDVPEDLYKPSRDLTQLDYKDEIVRILQCDFKKDEFDFNAGSSETMSNAVYARNKQVEEDLGIRFEYVSVNSNAHSPGVLASAVRQNAQNTEKDAFHIVAQPSYYSVSLILDGLYQDLATVENSYIDLSRKYWSAGFINASTVNDRYYFLVGELCTSVLDEMEVMFVNDQLVDDYLDGIDLHELVYAKGWTYDKMLSLLTEVGSGEESGVWGMALDVNSLSIDGMLASLKLTTVGIADNGMPKVDINNAHNIGIVEKLRDLYWNNPSVTNQGGAIKNFKDQQNAVFTMNMLKNAADLYKSGIRYTLIPMPMFDEKQDDYVVTAHDEYSSISICASVKDASMYTAVVEDLCYRSHDTTYNAKYEKTYAGQYAQTLKNRKMFDFMFDHLNFDLGAVYSYVLGECKNTPRYLLYPESIKGLPANRLSSIPDTFINLEIKAKAGLEKFIEFFYSEKS